MLFRSLVTFEERDKGRREYTLLVTNDHAAPVRFEAEFDGFDSSFRPSSRLGRRNGQPLWTATIPANGSATLHYRVTVREED